MIIIPLVNLAVDTIKNKLRYMNLKKAKYQTEADNIAKKPEL
jgi:hypothetical protein